MPATATPIHLTRPDAPDLARRGDRPVGVATAEAALASGRRLTVEIWYPAAAGTAEGTIYETWLRDGVTPLRLEGCACRGAPPQPGLDAPLIVISHGFPGNRYLLSHLGEHLAAQGFVVVAADHAGSTYEGRQDFAETLLYRPVDQRDLIDWVADAPLPLLAGADTGRVGVIGYSMGGYGTLVLGGAGLSEAAVRHERAPADGSLARHRAGSDSHEALVDPRVAAILPIGPWGRMAGFWDAEGLAGLRVPMLLMAGTADEVSGGEAMRRIFEEATGAPRHMLSFAHAGHNAAAPYPAPPESWAHSELLGWAPYLHHADPVWDTLRMNNITQHFATAFFGLHLRGDAGMRAYLGADFAGFPPETARGLSFETRAPTGPSHERTPR